MVVFDVYTMPIAGVLGVAAAVLGTVLCAALLWLWRRPRRGPHAVQRWAPSLALAFVVASLLALVAVPWTGLMRLQVMEHDLSEVVPPSRLLITELQLSLSLQGAALVDYAETGDEAHLARFVQSRDEQRRTYEQMRSLTARLGPEARARFDTLGMWLGLWHAAVGELAAEGRTPGMPLRGHPEARHALEEALKGVAQLDIVIARAADARWGMVSEARRRESWLAAILGGTAMAAALAVAWLGRRLFEFADEAESRRHDLERVMERKAIFARGLSHDLKNPLGAIDGHAELLEAGLRGELTEQQRDSVGRIRGMVRALLALIDDVLEVARAEAGQLSISPAPMDVRHLIQEAVEAHRGAALAAGLHLDLKPAPALPVVVTDAGRVRQVLDNLLSNAMKYTPRGGVVTVRAMVRAERRLGRGDRVAVDVCDTGPGIPAKDLERIFEEFARLDPRTGAGAGLGLAIARHIARLLDGDITVWSEDGRGSTFTLWLPLAPIDATRADA
jgi:signal transduction histidine kinase